MFSINFIFKFCSYMIQSKRETSRYHCTYMMQLQSPAVIHEVAPNIPFTDISQPIMRNTTSPAPAHRNCRPGLTYHDKDGTTIGMAAPWRRPNVNL